MSPIISGGGGGGGSQTVLLGTPVTLTAAQLRALSGAPVTLVAAPGAGKAIWLISWFLQYTQGTYPFSAPSQLRASLGASTAYILRQDLNDFTASGVAMDSPSEARQDLTETANKPLVLATSSSFAAGPIATTTKAAGGSGYAANDTGTVNGDQGDATYVVDTVDGGGAVLTYHITDGGHGYLVANSVDTSATSGAGSGFKINITAVNKGDGSIIVTPLYTTITLT